MYRANELAQEYNSIQEELQRLNNRCKELRQLRKEAGEKLYEVMNQYNMKQVRNIKINKIKPRQPIIRKKKKDIEKDAFKLFDQWGIPEPEKFWKNLQDTQRVKIPSKEEDISDDEDYSSSDNEVYGTPPSYTGLPEGFENDYIIG